MKVFVKISDTHDKLQSGSGYYHRKTLDLILDFNYFSFSIPNSHLTRHTYLMTKL